MKDVAMEEMVLLLCKYGSESPVIIASVSSNIAQVMCGICKNWDELLGLLVLLSYSIPGHPSCMLRNDVDLKKMIQLNQSIPSNYVDIKVFVEDDNPGDLDNDSL